MVKRFNYDAIVGLYTQGYSVRDVATVFDSNPNYIMRILKKKEAHIRPDNVIKIPISYGNFHIELKQAIADVDDRAVLRVSKISDIYKTMYSGFSEGSILTNGCRSTSKV
ncbi:hypothetical protein [Bacillus mycoides]|uniref:hypothetical protein n=1 Tax=Bacillus mycoides TaxID=1405 RepID=UPI003A8050C8